MIFWKPTALMLRVLIDERSEVVPVLDGHDRASEETKGIFKYHAASGLSPRAVALFKKTSGSGLAFDTVLTSIIALKRAAMFKRSRISVFGKRRRTPYFASNRLSRFTKSAGSFSFIPSTNSA